MNNDKSKSGWVRLKRLKYPLHDVCGNVILPAGTKNVDVKFRAGAFAYLNDQGDWVRTNKYRHNGVIYYGN